jgi:hypothetical protein
MASAALKAGSKCSFIPHNLRFFTRICLAEPASPTFFNSLLIGVEENIRRIRFAQAVQW